MQRIFLCLAFAAVVSAGRIRRDSDCDQDCHDFHKTCDIYMLENDYVVDCTREADQNRCPKTCGICTPCFEMNQVVDQADENSADVAYLHEMVANMSQLLVPIASEELQCSSKSSARPEEKCQNGGKCKKIDGKKQCKCTQQWTGAFCTLDVDECAESSSVCSPNNPAGTTCVNTEGSYKCECPSGFVTESDGRTCSGYSMAETKEGKATCDKLSGHYASETLERCYGSKCNGKYQSRGVAVDPHAAKCWTKVKASGKKVGKYSKDDIRVDSGLSMGIAGRITRVSVRYGDSINSLNVFREGGADSGDVLGAPGGSETCSFSIPSTNAIVRMEMYKTKVDGDYSVQWLVFTMNDGEVNCGKKTRKNSNKLDKKSTKAKDKKNCIIGGFRAYHDGSVLRQLEPYYWCIS